MIAFCAIPAAVALKSCAWPGGLSSGVSRAGLLIALERIPSALDSDTRLECLSPPAPIRIALFELPHHYPCKIVKTVLCCFMSGRAAHRLVVPPTPTSPPTRPSQTKRRRRNHPLYPKRNDTKSAPEPKRHKFAPHDRQMLLPASGKMDRQPAKNRVPADRVWADLLQPASQKVSPRRNMGTHNNVLQVPYNEHLHKNRGEGAG